jgi:dihydroorotase
MPNLKPAPDTTENLRVQTDIIKKDACIAVYPYATITRMQMGLELSDMEALSRECIAFSDDGRGVQDDEMMLSAMKEARSLGKMIVAHCEDNSLLFGGYIHDGEYARTHGHKGISSESEWRQIERDLALVEQTKCKYHVCHVSTKESVALIRDAKKRGLDVTCETAPHYLILDDSCMQEDARFKMNPPLRSKEDRDAMIEALLDGTIDMIATDHAPHSAEEKARGLADSAMGVVGIESAFSLMYTHFVRTGVITLERLVELMSKNPRVRFGIDSDVGFTIFETDTEFTLDPDKFLSKGRATPFAGERLFGRCLATVYNGKTVFKAE